MFYPLKVIRLNKPIKEATTIFFEVPEGLKEAFQYFPGQHLVMKLTIDGEELRRSYSINSCAQMGEELQVTVKKVKSGRVSGYIHEKLQVGDVIETTAPQGRFYASVQKEDYKTYFLFAAGSGITPILSILKTVLHESLESRVNLFYGNSNQDTILFKEELEQLEAQYKERLIVVHTLSSPKVWTTWKQWKGRKGRIDQKGIEWFIENHPPIAQSTEYFICGPNEMNKATQDTLMQLGIPKGQVHIEQFYAEEDKGNAGIESVDGAIVTLMVDGTEVQVNVPGGKTILQAIRQTGASPPYSCESGVCGTCAARVTQGKVEMKNNMALGDEELEKGWILTCQGFPVTKEITLEYDE